MTCHRVGRLMLTVAALLLIPLGAVERAQDRDQTRAQVSTALDAGSQFFPPGLFGTDHSPLERGYSRYLSLMGERPLHEVASAEHPQVYRVLVEVPPYNAPVVVRLAVTRDGAGELVAKVGRDGGHPQILTVNKTAAASRTEVDRFLELMDNAAFWSTPLQLPFESHRRFVMGGQGWMVEADKNGSYHLVCRAASELGALKGPAVFLVVTLAKLDLRSLPVGPAAAR